jgi:hypothetical protein
MRDNDGIKQVSYFDVGTGNGTTGAIVQIWQARLAKFGGFLQRGEGGWCPR